MPKKVTEYEKQDALDSLAANMDNVVLTSQQTKVPRRTLRDWQHKAILRGVYSPENIFQGRRREITTTPISKLYAYAYTYRAATACPR